LHFTLPPPLPHPSPFPTRRSSDLHPLGPGRPPPPAHPRRDLTEQPERTGMETADRILTLLRRESVVSGEALSATTDSRRSRVRIDRKSTRLNSSHVEISYAVFCLK